MAKAKPTEVTAFIESCKTQPRSKWATLTPEQREFIREVHAHMRASKTFVSESALSRGFAKHFGIPFGHDSIKSIWAMLDGEIK